MRILMMLGMLYYQVQCISFGIDGNSEKCFRFDAKANQQVTIQYIVTGINEDQMKIDFYDGKEFTVQSQTNFRENRIKHNNIDEQEMTLCFTTLDGYYKLVSFDIDLSGIDKNYAVKEQLEVIENKLKRVMVKMQRVYKNQHYQFDRERIHQQLLESTEKKVKWSALSKIIVLLATCLVQVYMLTNFFKDKSFGPSV